MERDVTVVIGARRAKSGQPVALDAFLRWLRLTTMDIRGLTYPSVIISTAHGDLILDPQLRGNLYHNGVTLPTSTSGAFLFTYNFARATTSCDRHRLASWQDAARQVTQIWEEDLRIQKETLLPVFVDLLQNHAHAADTELVSPLIESLTAQQISQYLLHKSADK